MNRGIKFAFGVHNHQPVGNFEGTFEEAYSHSYLPFMQTLQKHPRIRLTLHLPGILWEWIGDRHPEFFEIVSYLLGRNQLELMGGGFYEPILPMIPDSDKIGQIRKLSEYLKEHFHETPAGMWLAERVWEPQLPKPIAEAGIKYTCLDDSHFKMTGLKASQLYGYYITEEQGHSLAVFPIDMQMRYLVPFKPPERTIEYFLELATPYRERLIVLADDGEKFGVWPGTYKSVYEEGWLERFFTLLEENSDWIEMVFMRDHLERVPSLGTVYLPAASYTEMMEWALPAKETAILEDIIEETKRQHLDEYQRFLKGGFWRNFLAKYPEANNMQKKMLHVHKKVHSLPDAKRRPALDKLWAGQCNCSYWHGVFGGLYLNHIRAAVYGSLIEAENLADKILQGNDPFLVVEEADFYCNGSRALLCSNADMNAYFDLNRGGALFEWDLREKRFNVLNTLTRREEAYHRKLMKLAEDEKNPTKVLAKGDKSIHDIVKAKEKGLEKHLVYDWYRRSAFLDHFLGPDSTIEGFRRSDFEEQGNFTIEPYECSIGRKDDLVDISLRRSGMIFQEGEEFPLRLDKTLVFPKTGTLLEVRYKIENISTERLSLWFGTECNFALQAGNTDDRYYLFPTQPLQKQLLGSIGEDESLDWIGLVEEWVGIQIMWKFTQPALVWRFPIETVQNSEAGFEKTYQCSAVLASWKVTLEPGQSWSITTTLEGQDR